MSRDTEIQQSKCCQEPTSNAQICARFMAPAFVSCAIFIAQFAADLVVAVQHFREQNPIWGGCTLMLMYAPVLAYFLMIVSRPDWWMTDRDKSRGNVVVWFLLQVVQLVAFPFYALYRYATQIVLSVDAIFLSGEEKQKTLNEATAPSAIELYFFLQAWFQAIPQALFQLHLFFKNRTVQQTYQSHLVQIFCVLMSIIVAAKVTTSFQRYESQRISGRKLPWAMWYKKYNTQEMKNLEEKQPLHFESITQTTDKSSDQQQTENKELEKRVVLERKDSVTPPLPPKNAQIIPPPMPLRRITSITPLPVPDMPAPPRPDSIVSDPSENQSQTQSRYANSEAVEQFNSTASQPSISIRLPKRTLPSQGLEEDDTVGALLAFSWWYLFILARILSIIIFFEFFPYYSIGVIGLHYAVMITYLFYQSKFLDLTNVLVNLWLGYVYIFSVIEFTIKFKRAEMWLLLYYVFVIIQNSSMSVTWYLLGRYDSFWLEFIFYGIIVTMVLCVITTAVYFAMLKPKKRRIYVT